MKTKVSSNFKIVSWNEETISEAEGAGKLSKASVVRSFEGDLTGEGKIEYLMVYDKDGSAVYTGYERVTGNIADKKGTFFLRHEGVFKNGVADTACFIIKDSGTGGFSGIRGASEYKAGHEAIHPMSLDIEIA